MSCIYIYIHVLCVAWKIYDIYIVCNINHSVKFIYIYTTCNICVTCNIYIIDSNIHVPGYLYTSDIYVYGLVCYMYCEIYVYIYI